MEALGLVMNEGAMSESCSHASDQPVCMILTSEPALLPKLTQGWELMQGIGFEVLAQILESISPTHVLQLTTFSSNNNLPPDVWWLPEGVPAPHNLRQVYSLPSAGALQQSMGVDPSGNLRLLC